MLEKPLNERPEFSNSEIPEGINYSDEHPLKEFFWLTGGMAVLVVLVVIAFSWLGALMGSLVPFETEREIAAAFAPHFAGEVKERDAAIEAYLQDVADRLTRAEPLPQGMTVTLHYADIAEMNAFATLGGNIVVTRGLIEAMPNENALATVIAHEIAHVKERHVMRSLGRGVLTTIALSIVMGSTGDNVGDLVGQAGITTALSFSRDQEHEADAVGQRNVHALYGHVGGVSGLFEAMEQKRANAAPPEWLSTHPEYRNRIAALAQQAKQDGWGVGATIAIPPLPISEPDKNNSKP